MLAFFCFPVVYSPYRSLQRPSILKGGIPILGGIYKYISRNS
nr:MAG TPA: hypothetical protein [Caudoviricetes sp.]